MRLDWLLIFSLILVGAILAFSYALKKKIGILTLGAKDERFDNPGKRFMNFVSEVLGQRKMLNEPYGYIHFIIFWGFIFICLGELPLIFEGLFPAYSFPILGTNPYFYMIKDVLTALVVIGLIIGAIRRWIIRPARLYRTPEAAIIVLLILGVIVTEWISSGAKVAIESNSVYALAIMYNSMAYLFKGLSPDTLVIIQDSFWWIHMLIVFGFLVYIPNSKHMHLVAVHPNVYFSSLKPIGAQITPIDLEDEELTELGVARIESFTWKQLLDSFACGECGRCMDNCPANISGKPLNPKRLISRQLKEHLLEKGAVMNLKGLKSTGDESADALAEIAENDPQAAEILQKTLIGDIVTEDEIWACTTCMSCQVQCPVSNEHVSKIIDMRRSLVMMDSNFAPELQLAFRNVENNYNPWGIGYSDRANWASELDVKLISEDENVEYLFWVGCAGSFDSRAQKVSVAIAKILKAAGVDFAILGTEEKCCGDFIRRSGNEYMYQSMAAENIEVLNGYKVKKIITACPHCLNTLKNEYPEFGGNYEVIHHTQLIDQLIKDGKLVLNTKGEFEPQKIVYHDSCYLGRYQQEYKAPRALFNLVPGVELVEMERNHNKSFCCGAGGGRMWLEEHLGERINNLRVEQALDKNAQVIGANCPFCITMLEDGVKDKVDADKQTVKVVDPAELIAKMIS
ncbi:heterodisulfide reductase-related iron-sulfur binding cluster [Desulfosporosinus sp. Sb-LF]|uniref:heterodisulfide reductase-related iron-sulfur binding cluster n=1 Tax=Desulfosporosinus sp. Sb-LF TaxID=2560027 RepID=UPI00107F7305|nr:heterodisulfide reductase-related iron-sulfur binding cluster [Desulfosporosinus sp. Sb-LF]TGE33372.1 4Fe-4S dicluster domain-containing protein [Desulfosporosinus sp. Sb-LF]